MKTTEIRPIKRITTIYLAERKTLEWEDAEWQTIVAYDNEADALVLIESMRYSDRIHGEMDEYEYRIRQTDLLTDI